MVLGERVKGGAGDDSFEIEDTASGIYSGGTGDDDFIISYAVSGTGSNNTIDGGEGSETSGDSISYFGVEAGYGLTVDLSTVDGDGYSSAVLKDGSNTVLSTDLLKNIEDITGTSGSDTITGSADDNVLSGAMAHCNGAFKAVASKSKPFCILRFPDSTPFRAESLDFH